MDVLARMLEATIVTLREGMEVALVLATTLAYLRKTGRTGLDRRVFQGLGAALAASAAAAVAIHRYGLDPENAIWEGGVMLAAAALVGSLAVSMRRAGGWSGQRAEARLERLAGGRRRGTGVGFALFGFTFLMVLREGLEAALFLRALSGTVGADPLYTALGGGLGLLLALLLGALVVRGSPRLDPRRFFGVTGVVLVLLAAKLAANGLHAFFAAGLLPSSETLLAVVGLFTRERASVLLLVPLIAVPAGLLLREALEGRATRPRPEEPPVEARKGRAGSRAARLRAAAAGAAGLVLSVLLVLWALTVDRGDHPAPTALPLDGPLLRIPLSELREHPMKTYTVSVEGAPVRVFVVRGPGDRVAAAFDACAICPPTGYALAGEQLACRNCGDRVRFDAVGTPGGCRPVPLLASIEGGAILIRTEDLAAGRARFAR